MESMERAAEFATNSQLPAVYGFRELIPEGALMSLSADLSDIAARGPLYVDKAGSSGPLLSVFIASSCWW
jgi:hypothetical protein